MLASAFFSGKEQYVKLRSLLNCAPVFCSVISLAQTHLPVNSTLPLYKAKLAAGYGRLPLQFEANMGQTDTHVRFMAKAGGGTLFLTDTEAVLTLPIQNVNKEISLKPFDMMRSIEKQKPSPTKFTVLRMKLTGASKMVQVSGVNKLPGIVNYFRGNDPRKWHSNIPTYRKTKFVGVYKGVDMVYYGSQDGKLEYDFVVKPGANPKQIKLAFSGATKARVTRDGDLALKTEAGEVVWHKPVTYQLVKCKREKIECAYKLEFGDGKPSVEFAVASFDKSQPLVIDPAIQFSTYVGGSEDDTSSCITVDSNGSAYITGTTNSVNFPTTAGAFQTVFSRIYPSTVIGFVTKLSADGSSIVYSTYLGGSTGDEAVSIAVDSQGNAYVTGVAVSTDFPTTAGALQTVSNGNSLAFITKLNANGSSLIYSTYIGGDGDAIGIGIAIDSIGYAYITGYTDSNKFPTTPGAFQRAKSPTARTAYVLKLSTNGTSLIYSTFIGGSDADLGYYIALDRFGNAYITGVISSPDFPITPGAAQVKIGGFWDAFVTKLNADGTGLIYSTYIGGTSKDEAGGIAVDSSGNAYIIGTTNSPDFPTTVGVIQPVYSAGTDAFVTKVSADGSSFVYSTYLGGISDETGNGIAVDIGGNAFVTGSTRSTEFPTTSDAYQTAIGGYIDAFITKLSANGSSLLYSTYFGGTGGDFSYGIVLDKSGSVYVTGITSSLDFYTTVDAFQTSFSGGYHGDAFVSKFNFTYNLYLPHLEVYASKSMIEQNINLTARITGLNGVALSGKTLIFSVNGNIIGKAITNANGVATLVYFIPQALGLGDKPIKVTFDGDLKYYNRSESSRLTVLPIADSIGLGQINAKAGTVMYAGARLVTWNGVAITGRTIYFAIDGATIGSAITDANGGSRYYYKIPQETKSGKHSFSADFPGDGTYDQALKQVTLTIASSNTSVSVYNQSGYPGQSRNLQCRLLNDSGHVASRRIVTYSLNGMVIGTSRTNILGYGNLAYTIPDNLEAGPQTLTISFAGDDVYNGCSGTGSLTISKANTSLYMVDTTINSEQSLRLPVRLIGASGNYIVGRAVSLTVNGISAGTAVTQSNGNAAFTYTLPTGTGHGTYTISASFAGDSAYNASTVIKNLIIK